MHWRQRGLYETRGPAPFRYEERDTALRTISVILAVAATAFVFGCKEKKTASSTPAAPDNAPIVQPLPATEAATITGQVKVTGSVAPPKPLPMGSDCHHAGGEKPLDTSVVAAPGGELANVFVYVKNFSGRMAPPEKPILLDQKNCIYEPRVSGVQTNQIIQIRNSDATFHNVHAVAKENEEFNFGQNNKGAVDLRKFTKPEVMVKVKCDVHPWMKSYVGVMDHSYFAISDASGNFSISGLPAGTWELEAWHETLGVQNQTVTVPAKGTAPAAFTFAGK